MTYKVRLGDTLSTIARRNGISLAQLLKTNPQISNPDRIQIGQVINLPDTSTDTTQPLPSNVVPAITSVAAAAAGAAAGAIGARTEPKFDEQLIRAIYAERGRTKADGSLVYFSKSSPNVQKGVANRFKNELNDALAMLAKEV